MATKRRRRTTTATKRRKTTRTRRKKKNPIKFEVDKHIAREIWAVVYLAIAALTWISLKGQMGFLGDMWVGLLAPIFGVGISALPVLFLFMGASVFLSKKVSWGAARLTGIGALLFSVLGFVHMSFPLDQLLNVAQAGEGGGYVGFMASAIQIPFGSTGAYVLLTAIFLVGILLTLQVSLGAVIRFFIPSAKTFKKAAAVVSAVTPEIEFVEREHRQVKGKSQLKIVKPEHYVEEDEVKSKPKKSAMAVREVTPEQVEARIKKQMAADHAADAAIKKVEDAKVPDGEIVMVDHKPTKKVSSWQYPSLDLLDDSKETFSLNRKDIRRKADMIQWKLEQFGIKVNMHEVHVGPTVVQYTLKPADGVKLSKIISLKNDLALALAAQAVRIEAPIPGKSLVGIEIPSETRSVVHMKEIMETKEYRAEKSKLKLPLGRDVSGGAVIADLGKMPHLLIAGATGAGKSVGMNAFLISLLYNNSPKELRMILIDPKQVELSTYNGLPHLLTPVITDAEKAATSLRWAVAEMNRRYKVCAEVGARNVGEYNKGRRKADHMCKIVIVIDELADLMMQAQKEVEASICRIAQMARAVGMHLIIATQRPSVDVITGLIKANIPARIAFTVASSIDSRTILDAQGAEDLLGRGDMLYLSGTMGKPVRVQGIWITTEEIERIVNKLKLQMDDDGDQVLYQDAITSKETAKISVRGMPDIPDAKKTDDDLMALAIECLKQNRKAASTSSMQRYLRIGYARAARIVDMLEDAGIVGPARGSKPRDVFLREENSS
jgi:S-DNA-T family DNA segregation ATPase FtsK/SpoIIIE